MDHAQWNIFFVNLNLKEKLLATGNAEIVEHTSNDGYWGDGGDGSGKNMLGKLLMETRKRIRNELFNNVEDISIYKYVKQFS